MKKIMFSDKYGLTQAVLEGRKTMARRAISEDVWQRADVYRHEYYEDTLGLLPAKKALIEFSPFKVGEVVAVAQAYKDTFNTGQVSPLVAKAGWTNKMFVRADWMLHQIRITNVRVEKLQDISDEDCMKEGITTMTEGKYDVGNGYGWDTKIDALKRDTFFTPRKAFAALIDKVSGKGTWNSNPWVFVYEFELVK